MRSCGVRFALVGCLIISSGAAAALEPVAARFKVGLGYNYSTGNYGTSETTEISYVPLTLNAQIGRWSVQGTIPYLRISGPGGFIQGPDGPIQTTSGESDGLGDTLLRGSYALPPINVWMPFIEVFGLVKFPTASREKGLGTGEFDFGLETEVAWAVGRFSPFAVVGYRFLGSPPDTPLDNVFLGSVGGVYRILDSLTAGVLLDYRQAPSANVGERLEIVPFASWRVHPQWVFDVYTTAGLSSGSPDFGVGLQIGFILDRVLWGTDEEP